MSRKVFPPVRISLRYSRRQRSLSGMHVVEKGDAVGADASAMVAVTLAPTFPSERGKRRSIR